MEFATIQELKNVINDSIYENSSGLVTAVILQERLHDIIDTLNVVGISIEGAKEYLENNNDLSQIKIGTNKAATEGYVVAAIAAMVDSAPGALDTLNELAAALGDDPNFATTITGLIAAKLDAATYTASDIKTKLLTVDGTGSGIDADLLDGQHLSYITGLIAAKLSIADYIDFSDVFEIVNQGEIDEYLRLKKPMAADYSIQLFSDQGQFPPTIWESLPLATATVLGVFKYDSAIFELNGSGQLTIKDGVIAPEAHDHDDRYMTDAEVGTAIGNALAALVDSAPGTLDTLNELAAALGDDPNFATTITGLIAAKLDASAYTANDVLAKILSLDGAGSGIDADLLDGQHAAYYTGLIAAKLDSTAYTAADVKAKLITVDGSGSGIDADLLDGQHGSYYAPRNGGGGESTISNYKIIAGRESDSLLHIAGNASLAGNLHLNYWGGNVYMFNGTAGTLQINGVTESVGELRVKNVTQKLTFDTTGIPNTAWLRTINDYDFEFYLGRGTTSKVILSSNGQVELYYGTNKKIETSSDGAIISGSLVATAVGSPSSTDFITKRAGTTISKITSDNKVHFKDTIMLYSDQV